MVFSNPLFWVFFVATMLVLAVPMGLAAKKRALTAASCLFYAAWDVRYLGLLLGISVVDHVCATRIEAASDARRRRVYLLVSIVSNLGVLGYFKYTNFFLENVRRLGVAAPAVEILLPAGISFYTFKTMSYVIDVYRRELRPCASWLDYAMFITFFPELIAGPIVRASVFLPQMGRDPGPRAERLARGGSLFLLGFTKKVLADKLGIAASPVFAAPQDFTSGTAWAALLAYTLQIYLDFSGYSDMAVGCAKCLGYDLPENFRMPYLSRDVTEFWRRWHITLSTWLRDYLYIPLGGNRRGPVRTYANLAATMVLGGLWHGASWNFVVWGALHGGALAVHRFVRARTKLVVPDVLAVPGTLLFVALCWVPFRCTTSEATLAMFRALVPGTHAPGEGMTWVGPDLPWIVALVVVGHAVGVALDAQRGARLLRWFGFGRESDAISGTYLRVSGARLGGAWVLGVWLLLVLLFAPTATTPFIYFQF